MQRARLLGHAVSSAKHPSMQGFRLMVGSILGASGGPDGDPVLIVDTLGAGVGSTVLLTNDGRYAREVVGQKRTPIRFTTIAIEDDGCASARS